ncbi:MAG: phytanoyl-CoA dioxygenase family protein [Rhizobiaceae bacterium]
MQLSNAQREAYEQDGFLVVEGVLSRSELAELRRITDEFVEKSRAVSAHDDVYDLEPGHSSDQPRVRRIKTPHSQHAMYNGVMKHPSILAILRQLIGPAIRFDTSKLNMKQAGFGGAVEWHQDWAFYPHTNADLCAVGIMMDDCELENGPLLCVPGSHKGPVYDHHTNGAFCGAIDPVTSGVDFDKAVACTGPAGSISIHHALTIHGSAVNTSTRSRRLLLYQYRAADAWPLVGSQQLASWEAWNDLLLCGDNDPVLPRLTQVEVRLPLPVAKFAGSIFENQRELKNSYFGSPEELKAVGAM